MAKYASKAISYLALGDSYTVGEGVKPKHSFPLLLAKRFRKQHFKVTIRVIAKTGWTTDELIEALGEEKIKHKYDLVSLLIGVNNQYRNYPDGAYGIEFEQLLKKALGYAKRPEGVFAVSIPDYGCTPFGLKNDSNGKIGLHIDKLNTINRSICNGANIRYFDITPDTRDLSVSGLLAKDGLHYSKKMYRRWVRLIYPNLCADALHQLR